MKKTLENKYKKVKMLIKKNKNGNLKDEIKKEKISIYVTVLSYYSAKLDLKMSKIGSNDKIILKLYNNLLIKELNVDEVLDGLVYGNNETKRGNFYDSIDFLHQSNNITEELSNKMREDYNAGYLATVLNYNQKKLNFREDRKIYKEHEKTYKLLRRKQIKL